MNYVSCILNPLKEHEWVPVMQQPFLVWPGTIATYSNFYYLCFSVEIATLTRKDDKTEIRILPDSEVENIINICETEAKSKESAAGTSSKK